MNVLIFLTDQQQRGSLGAYGNEVVLTPRLDALAAQSVVFENAVCAQPVCTPSRCSLWSGVYPHTHGVVDNYHPLPRRWPTLAELVVDAGYRTGYLGKWHLGNEVLPQRGFEQFFGAVDDNYTARDDRALYGLSGYGRWLIAHGIEPDEPARDGVPASFTREFTARLPARLAKATYIAEEACRFLDCRRAQPFLLVCSFLEPHNPYHSEFDALHPRDAVALPANFHPQPLPGWPLRNIAFQNWARTVAHGDETAFDSEDKWRDVIARYYGACHLVDTAVGRVLDQLSACGLEEDTLVLFTSDHGDMMGSHGMLMKSMMFEESQGVPLIVRLPGCRPRRLRQPVCLVDVLPTCLAAMGVAGPEHLQGENLLPLLRETRAEDPEATAVCEWNGVIQNMFAKHEMFAAVKDDHIRSIRSARWKLNCYRDDADELYDLEQDPGELRNRIADADCAEVVAGLQRRLAAWQQRTGDNGIIER